MAIKNKTELKALFENGDKLDETSFIDLIDSDLNKSEDVVDNLNSIITDKSLSANQGKLLNDLITTNINNILTKQNADNARGLYSNAIINGKFEVDQYGSLSITPIAGANGVYHIDMWKIKSGLATEISINETDNVKSLKLNCTTGGSQRMSLSTGLELVDLLKFKDKTLTISCMMKTNNPSIAHIELHDGVSTQKSGFATLTDTWEEVKLTIAYTNQATINGVISFGFGGVSGTYAIATNDYVEIKDVQMSLGSERLPENPLSYADELRKCQRYYFKIIGADKPIAIGAVYSTTKAYATMTFPVEMMIDPSLSISATNAFTVFRSGGSESSTAIAIAKVSKLAVELDIDVTITAGLAIMVRLSNTGTDWISLDANL
jgi:Phage tail fiber repeats